MLELVDKELAIPEVEISQQGIGEKRIDPSVLSFIFQAAQLSQLTKMRKSQERMEKQTKWWQDMQVPTGGISLTFKVGTEITEMKFDPPLTGFAFENDGPGNIKSRINSKDGIQNEFLCLSGDGYYYDFKFAIIKSIFFLSDAADTVIDFSGAVGQCPSPRD